MGYVTNTGLLYRRDWLPIAFVISRHLYVLESISMWSASVCVCVCVYVCVCVQEIEENKDKRRVGVITR